MIAAWLAFARPTRLAQHTNPDLMDRPLGPQAEEMQRQLLENWKGPIPSGEPIDLSGNAAK
jgi:hypothetical protein